MAAVSCADCQKWLYDGEWRQIMRGGQPMQRPPHSPTPCDMCPKVPLSTRQAAKEAKRKVTPADAAEWTPENVATWGHYWATKSGACPPQDAASREMCGYLEQIIQLSNRKLHDPAKITGSLLHIINANR